MAQSLLDFIQHSDHAFAMQSDPTIYIQPHIPANKLAGAMSSYVNQSAVKPNDIILLVDDTVFGGARQGLVVTEQALYAKELFSSSKRLPLHTIKSIAWGSEFLSNCLYINGFQFISMNQISKSGINALSSVINDYIQQVGVKPSPQSHQTKNSAQNNNHKDPEDFELYLIMVDILAYFALLKNNAWTSEKVQFIKHALVDALETPAQMERIKERIKLKLKIRPRLEQSIQALLPYVQQHENARIYITLKVCGMLHVAEYPESMIIYWTKNFGQQMALEPHVIDNILEECATNDDQDDDADHDSYQDYFEHQQHDQNHRDKSNDSITWACQILGIDPHSITVNQVQQAYRLKIKEFHPDKYQTLPDSIKRLLNEKTQELNKAKDILTQFCAG
jgi:hypothetical protein